MKNLIELVKSSLLEIAIVAIGIVIAIGLISVSLPKANGLSGGISLNNLGGSLTVTNKSIQASAKILDSSSGRQYALIQAGAKPVYLRFYAPTTTDNTYYLATSTNAVYLPAYGSYVINNDNLYTGEVWATSTTEISIMNITVKQ